MERAYHPEIGTECVPERTDLLGLTSLVTLDLYL